MAASPRAFCLYLAIALTASCSASRDKADDAKAATDVIRQQIDKYTAALDAADIDLASQVWRTSADVSFIHPYAPRYPPRGSRTWLGGSEGNLQVLWFIIF